MDQTVNTGAIAQGFAALAQALSPNYQGMIEADLARYKRDNLVADTGYRDALTGKTAVETSGIAANNAAYDAARTVLSSGNLTDPTSMGTVLAGLVRDNPQAAGQFLAAARANLDPAFVASPTYSDVLVGSGVQPYQNTPAGVKLGLQNNIDVQKASDDGALARQDDEQAFGVAYPDLYAGRRGSSGTPLDVNPLDLARLTELAKGQIAAKTGMKVSDGAAQQVAIIASQIYQQTRDAGAALNAALAMVDFTTSGVMGDGTNSTINPFNWPMFNTDTVASATIKPDAAAQLTNILAPPAANPADNPAATTGAAPTTGAGGGTITVGGQTYTEGQTVTLRDGRKFTVTNGQFVQVQ